MYFEIPAQLLCRSQGKLLCLRSNSVQTSAFEGKYQISYKIICIETRTDSERSQELLDSYILRFSFVNYFRDWWPQQWLTVAFQNTAALTILNKTLNKASRRGDDRGAGALILLSDWLKLTSARRVSQLILSSHWSAPNWAWRGCRTRLAEQSWLLIADLLKLFCLARLGEEQEEDKTVGEPGQQLLSTVTVAKFHQSGLGANFIMLGRQESLTSIVLSWKLVELVA